MTSPNEGARSPELQLLLELRDELRDWRGRLEVDLRLIREETQRLARHVQDLETTCNRRAERCPAARGTPLPSELNENW